MIVPNGKQVVHLDSYISADLFRRRCGEKLSRQVERDVEGPDWFVVGHSCCSSALTMVILTLC
jgi:hypothetical protein